VSQRHRRWSNLIDYKVSGRLTKGSPAVSHVSAERVRATYKARDSWWTVLLVDPMAGWFVRFAARRPWLTPNLLTGVAFALGLGAAAAFVQATPGWLVVGAIVYHVSFVIDCMDGKVARVNGTGSIFGSWLDFFLDRMRVAICTVALFGGQFTATGNPAFLYTAIGVLFLALIGYLNGAEINKATAKMARAAASGASAASATGYKHPIPERVRAALHHRRIRLNLVSAIEFEMAAFVIAPLIAAVTAPVAIIRVTLVVAALLVAFEFALIVRFWRRTRAFSRAPADAGATRSRSDR
jgi:phosphatidylglycerophosphate synthase